MKINELSSITGATKETIRYYESIDLIHPARDMNNYRNYTSSDLKNLVLIIKLKSLNMSLTDIKRLIDIKNKKISIECKQETMLFLNEYKQIALEKLDFFTRFIRLLSDIEDILDVDEIGASENKIVKSLMEFEEEI